MFRPGIVILPAGSSGAPTGSVTIESSSIAQLFSEYGVDSVARAFPDFQPGDTLGVARTGEIVRLVDRSLIWTLVLSEESDRIGFAQALGQEAGVIYAEPNGRVEPCAVFPDDPRFQNLDQWNLHNTGQNGGTPDADIDAPESWEITTGSPTTKIGIIDTGLDNSHPDLAGKVTGDLVATAHGSEVGGIAAAKTDNGVGIAGVDWGGRLHSEAWPPASTAEEFDASVAQALADALSADCQITNHSYIVTDAIPGVFFPPRYSATIRAAFADAYKLNTVSVAAMGNSGVQNPSAAYDPAAFRQGVIAVGATNRFDQRPGFSSFGDHIDVCAPGEEITTTTIGGGYRIWYGTSLAAPHVAGLAGLMLAVNPLLYNDDIEQLMRRTADDLGEPGWDQYYGAGRINARRALEQLLPPYVLRGHADTGGTIVGSSGLSPLTLISVPGLADGEYIVRRHEVWKTTVFPVAPNNLQAVWGRGVGTVGYSDESPNFGMGWCEPLAGSSTQSGCTMRTFIYEVFDAQQSLIGWFPTTAGNVVFHYAVLDLQGGGGCPVADTRTEVGWQQENTVLGRSETGSLLVDGYRLKHEPSMRDGRVEIRLRENGAEFSTLDELRLVAVDHAPGVRAFSSGGRFILGTREPAHRVTTARGRDITTQVSGGQYFWGSPGETLLVQMTGPSAAGANGAESSLDDPGGSGLIESDPKELEVAGGNVSRVRPTSPAEAEGAPSVDSTVLATTGIVIESPDGAGGWRPLARHYPRASRDEAIVDSMSLGKFRVIFRGRHRLHFVGRVTPVESGAIPVALDLLSARHSRLGDVIAAVATTGGATAPLVPGDSLTFVFAAASAASGAVREWFLVTRGIYSSRPLRSEEARAVEESEAPIGSALRQNEPNPFRERTAIRFELTAAGRVRIDVFDLQGRRVARLVDAEYPAGDHRVEWDGRDERGAAARAGIYLYRIEAGGHRAQRRLVILP